MQSMETKTNTQTLSVGVIGTGGMGTRHALNVHRAVGNARVSAVYDLDLDRARQVAGMCGQALVFDDPERLINDSQVDAVMIVSPDDTHARLTLACLQAGKPVLSEKPLATTVEDAVRLLRSASLGAGSLGEDRDRSGHSADAHEPFTRSTGRAKST